MTPISEEEKAARASALALARSHERIEKLERSLRGLVDHWYEFGEMMFADGDDYGFGERIDYAHDLVHPPSRRKK